MRDRKILTVNEENILEQAQKRAAELIKKAGIVLPERFPTIKVR